ncbi:1-deoxy-D-xylulose-5-phosphate reductoisomerase [Zhaonella formicivorans]|uniref:1-deoxy-D-xylulose-5-phosphate reductoisomerase n=1 Tax=Zhaonella formicivorans TaxID=2528593 RepID=UPI001D1225E9|nr:1-deoxy-D-xylulose-5-phosphate reductoisomerase [Zhaonella formicivorans]
MNKGIALLGSTGSIGRQTLEVVDAFPEQLKIHALVAGSNIELLSRQILFYKPQVAVIADRHLLPALQQKLGNVKTKILAGEEGIREAVALPEVDIVITAVSGVCGLRPTLEAIRLGKNIALANKETLVAAGQLVMEEARKNGVAILPVDSEHSAIFQCLQNQAEFAESIILTASGGPFRGWQKEELSKVTPQMALRHPNWIMGSKITVDSATLVNKGLEVIEAHWLFAMPLSKIEVLVHPQSIIHSLVRFRDGSMLAQLGLPDMRLPIQYALTWPARWENKWQRLDLTMVGQLTFEKPDYDNFPGLKLAYQAGLAGGTAPCIYNAANEKAVQLFLAGRIGFTQISELIEYSLDTIEHSSNPELEEILTTDLKVREIVERRAEVL